MAGGSEETADQRKRRFEPRASGIVTMAYGAYRSQRMDLRFPDGAGQAALILVLHGGFWRLHYDRHHAAPLCVALTRAGFITANVEYRRLPEPGSGWPGTFDDVEAALGFVRTLARERHPRINAVFVIGHSAGGHLALWLAGQPRAPDGVVALAPVASLADAWRRRIGSDAVVSLLSGTPDDAPTRYDGACAARRPARAPRLLIHGDADETVSVDLSRQYMDARSADPVFGQLNVMPGAGHFDLIDPASAVWPSVLNGIESFVDDVVRPRSQPATPAGASPEPASSSRRSASIQPRGSQPR